MSTNTIYEFSRGFVLTHWSNGETRVVRYGANVDRSSASLIPALIENAVVKERLFAINDNTPPAEGDFALIARDIGDYSIIAVASLIKDEINRRTIAYRYFWLKRSPVDGDGIFTLLKWWQSVGMPRFLKPDQLFSPSSVNLERFVLRSNDQSFENYYPYIDALDQSKDFNSVIDTHLLACQIHQKSPQSMPLSWAWNVRLLERSSEFLVIQSTDPSAVTKIKQQLSGRNMLSKHSDPIKYKNKLDPPKPYSHPETPKHSELSIQWLVLKEAIRRSVESSEKYESNSCSTIKSLVNTLEQFYNAAPNVKEWNWDEIKDKQLLNNALLGSFVIRYQGLYTLICPDSLSDLYRNYWNRYDSKSRKEFISIQKLLLKTSHEYSPIVYDKIKNELKKSISVQNANIDSRSSRKVKKRKTYSNEMSTFLEMLSGTSSFTARKKHIEYPVCNIWGNKFLVIFLLLIILMLTTITTVYFKKITSIASKSYDSDTTREEPANSDLNDIKSLLEKGFSEKKQEHFKKIYDQYINASNNQKALEEINTSISKYIKKNKKINYDLKFEQINFPIKPDYINRIPEELKPAQNDSKKVLDEKFTERLKNPSIKYETLAIAILQQMLKSKLSEIELLKFEIDGYWGKETAKALNKDINNNETLVINKEDWQKVHLEYQMNVYRNFILYLLSDDNNNTADYIQKMDNCIKQDEAIRYLQCLQRILPESSPNKLNPVLSKY